MLSTLASIWMGGVIIAATFQVLIAAFVMYLVYRYIKTMQPLVEYVMERLGTVQ